MGIKLYNKLPIEIKPIYKKCDKTLITNQRPISLLPVFSKIFEKLYTKDYITI